MHDKSEELSLITSERDKLFSEVVQKESRIQDLLEEIEKTKNDLAATQLNYKSTDQEFQDFKNHHIEFEQKYKMVLEENERMNQEIGNLSKQAQKLGLSLDAFNTEVGTRYPLGKQSLVFWALASVYIPQNALLFTFSFSYFKAFSQI